MKRPLMIPFITYNVTTYKKPKNQNISDWWSNAPWVKYPWKIVTEPREKNRIFNFNTRYGFIFTCLYLFRLYTEFIVSSPRVLRPYILKEVKSQIFLRQPHNKTYNATYLKEYIESELYRKKTLMLAVCQYRFADYIQYTYPGIPKENTIQWKGIRWWKTLGVSLNQEYLIAVDRSGIWIILFCYNNA